MAKLVWDASGEKKYFLGTKKGVLYIPNSSGEYPKGVVWNGLTQVSDSPSGGDAQDFYADDILYGSVRGAEKKEGSIECYTYPDEFEPCTGRKEVAKGIYISGQERKPFGFSYVNSIGNDTEGLEHGYQIHLVYGATVNPVQHEHSTMTDSPEAETMTIDYSCVPVATLQGKPSAEVILDSTLLTPEQLTAIEDVIYGSAEKEARLPLPDEVFSIISGAGIGG